MLLPKFCEGIMDAAACRRSHMHAAAAVPHTMPMQWSRLLHGSALILMILRLALLSLKVKASGTKKGGFFGKK